MALSSVRCRKKSRTFAWEVKGVRYPSGISTPSYWNSSNFHSPKCQYTKFLTGMGRNQGHLHR